MKLQAQPPSLSSRVQHDPVRSQSHSMLTAPPPLPKMSIVVQLRHLPCCLLLVKIKPHLEGLGRNFPNRISQTLALVREQLLGKTHRPVASENRTFWRTANCALPGFFRLTPPHPETTGADLVAGLLQAGRLLGTKASFRDARLNHSSLLTFPEYCQASLAPPP